MGVPAQCKSFALTLHGHGFGFFLLEISVIAQQSLILKGQVHDLKFSGLIPKCDDRGTHQRPDPIHTISCFHSLHNQLRLIIIGQLFIFTIFDIVIKLSFVQFAPFGEVDAVARGIVG